MKKKSSIEKRTSRVLINFSNNHLTKDLLKDSTQKGYFHDSVSREKNDTRSDEIEVNEAPKRRTIKFNTHQESIPENNSDLNTPENSRRDSKNTTSICFKHRFKNIFVQSDHFSISNEYAKDQKKKILIVDDDNFCRKTVCLNINKILKELNLNCEVIQEDDGLGLIQRVLKEKSYGLNSIKLIISDENMNILNGSQALNIVKTIEEKKKSHKIIKYILTAIEDDKNFDHIRNISGAEIIKKPAKKDLLKELIKKVS